MLRPIVRLAIPSLLLASLPAQTLSLVKDLNTLNQGTTSNPYPAAADLHVRPADTQTFVRLGNLVFFVAEDETHGQELWVTDGAVGSYPNGTTRMVRDIRSGPLPSYPANLFVHAGVLWFTADDGIFGTNIWTSDGTAAGTRMVNGTSQSGGAGGGYFAPLSPVSFVYNGSPVGGGSPTLWVMHQSGATLPQTSPANWCNPQGCTALPTGGVVFRNGRTSQLNFFDGTLVHNLSTSAGPLQPDKFVRLGNRVLFTARNNPNTTGLEPWVTDGTPAGTFPLADVRPGTLAGANFDIACVHAGALYFKGYDAIAGSSQQQLWRSDGTLGGTFQVSTASTPLYGITAIESDGAQMLIGTTSSGIFRSDGTLAGTTLLWNCNTVSHLEHTAGRFWWRQISGGAYDELCWSDGTVAGTGNLVGAGPGSGGLAGCAYMVEIAPGTVLLRGDDGIRGAELWRSDGTLAGTHLVGDLHGATWTRDSAPDSFAELAPGRVVFAADDGVHGRELWITDGTAAGTSMIVDLEPGPVGSMPTWCVALRGLVLFSAHTSSHGRELWRSDGTLAGTSMVKDLDPTIEAMPMYLTRVGDRVFFNAGDSVHGTELWVTDGTGPGTQFVVDLDGGGSGNPSDFCELGDTGICFFRSSLGGDQELWRSDGTAAGTWRFADLNPGGSSSPSHLTRLGDRIVFAAQDATHGMEPWITDGTLSGTWMIADLLPGPGFGDPTNFAGDDFGHCVFLANSASQGREIWRTDGTPAGTSIALDLVPGAGDLLPTRLVWMGNRHLYFAGSTGAAGREPYVSRDGQILGTGMLADLNSGAAGSIGSNADAPPFADSLGRLYFGADNGALGDELHVVDQGAWARAQGSPCGTGSWRPRLAATPPVLGQPVTFATTKAPLGTFTALLLGFGPPAPLHLGNGCTNHFAGPFAVLAGWIAPPAATWNHQVQVPADPLLAGIRLSAQGIYTVNATAMDAMSNGVWLQLGF